MMELMFETIVVTKQKRIEEEAHYLSVGPCLDSGIFAPEEKDLKLWEEASALLDANLPLLTKIEDTIKAGTEDTLSLDFNNERTGNDNRDLQLRLRYRYRRQGGEYKKLRCLARLTRSKV